jgi:hypothetical protein
MDWVNNATRLCGTKQIARHTQVLQMLLYKQTQYGLNILTMSLTRIVIFAMSAMLTERRLGTFSVQLRTPAIVYPNEENAVISSIKIHNKSRQSTAVLPWADWRC